MYAHRLPLLFLGTIAVISAAAGLPTAAMAGVVTGGGVYEPPAGFWSTYPPTNTFLVINFDTDTTGAAITNGTAITNQYQPWGVTFSLVSPPATAKLVANSPSSVLGNLSWGDDSISNPNTLACYDSSINGPLWVRIDFLPGNFPWGLPREAGLVFTDSPQNDPFTLKAYDINGVLVDSAVSNTADSSYASTGHAEDTFLGVTNAGGIRHLEYSTEFMWGGGIWGSEIDNVYFEVRFVPEPATILLMGLGSLMLIRRRARQRCAS